MLGNQGGPGGPNGSRDPLTFLVAQDGLHYDIHCECVLRVSLRCCRPANMPIRRPPQKVKKIKF